MLMRYVLACGAAATLAFGAAASAATPDPAVGGGSAYVFGNEGSHLETSGAPGPVATSAGAVKAVADSAGSPSPFVLAHAVIGDGASDSASAGAQVIYSYTFHLDDSPFAQLLSQQVTAFQASGFGAPTVRARGSGYFVSDAGGTTLGYIYGFLGAGTETRFNCNFGLGDCGWQDFDVAIAITSVDNLDFSGQVLLYASAAADAGPRIGSEALAYLDPELYFPDHSEVTFILSSGFANATGGHNAPPAYADLFPGAGTGGVPEPASWALMITGFGLSGATLRRRRRIAA
ncbi:PEPxxWA-CTERM sorting domain-containing protein [Phenylobacterium sp.]|uniref:PEPxxWA-CTERM sorting domain-containing protein n=1 Tax=Phenylobacterium sp. TaxID=1871053 RepID=UPI0025FAF55B|nr:PEPxxWA-CTERM sorting domain-containing protein [Phenylobacterium sp.]MBX3482937.1 PEP-CTERM sorting domain-containing protein [Phenylobacterium sp.]MCW5760487.1 PEP-CTERM sorting domain-containing protein [Phenylobacterium sp.]